MDDKQKEEYDAAFAPIGEWYNNRMALYRIEAVASKLGIKRANISLVLLENYSHEDWSKIAMELATELVKQESESGVKLDVTASVMNVYINKHEIKRKQDKKRVANRQDQAGKREFQEAVRFNIESYSTIEDAVNDLQDKPQFNYHRMSLRKWAKEVWPASKVIKRGRPKTKKP